MIPYEAGLFDPPAPIARVVLRNLTSSKTLLDVSMILDSGADVTLIPANFVKQLGLDTVSQTHYELMAFDGSVIISPSVELEMVFLQKSFKGRFLVIEQEWGVIGRDILNLISLILNGPQLTWNEYKVSKLLS